MEPTKDDHGRSKYLRPIHPAASGPDAGKPPVVVDLYEVLAAFPPGCDASSQAAKKILMPGKRGKGSRLKDLKEAAVALQRAIEMEERAERLRGECNGGRTGQPDPNVVTPFDYLPLPPAFPDRNRVKAMIRNYARIVGSYLRRSGVSESIVAEVERGVAELADLSDAEDLLSLGLADRKQNPGPRSDTVGTEPCCECGDPYPRVDLLHGGEVYCPKCRKLVKKPNEP